MKILLTGAPATGKTTILKKLGDELKIKTFVLSDFIIKNKIFTEYNKKYSTFEYSEKYVNAFFRRYLKDDKLKKYIIESHTPSSLYKIEFDVIFLFTLNPKYLRELYLEREYNEEKIQENIDCQVLELIKDDCLENFKCNVITIDRTNMNIESVLIKLRKFL